MKSNEFTTERKSKLPYIITAVIILLGALILLFFIVSNDNANSVELESEDFLISINDFAQQMNSGDYQQALAAANDLLELSDSDLERGRASLSVALAERPLDPVSALERFKDISRTPEFHPFVRAMAIWYVVESYSGNRDSTFAREHIYTGDMWSGFVDSSYIDNPDLMYHLATIAALRTSLDYSITAQASMRLAAESANLLHYDEFTQKYKNATVQAVQEYIALADQELVEIRSQNVARYAGSEFITVLDALNSKALALDTLYASGYITDRAVVTNAYQEAIDANAEYDIEAALPFFVRYNYADFLARSNFEDNTSTINTILAPLSGLSKDSAFAEFVKNRIARIEGNNRSQQYPGHPQTMIKLASISPEFKAVILSTGYSESDLAAFISPEASASSTPAELSQ